MKKESVITIDLGASKVRFSTVTAQGESTEYSDIPPVNILNLTSGKELIDILADGINKIQQVLNEGGEQAIAISIGSPGPLDPFKGVIEEAPNLKSVKNLAVIDELKKILPDLPIFLLNDADSAGLGEWWLGAGKGHEDIVLLTLGTGVGSGVIAGNKLQCGLGKAAEWGHTSIFIESDPRLCSCGQWSCSETYLGTKGLSATYAKVFGVKIADLKDSDRHSISPKMREGIKANNSQWLKVQEEYTKHLAILLRNIIMVHQPEVVILGGGIAYGNIPLLSKTKIELEKLMDIKNDKMGHLIQGVEVKLAQFENAGNLGAAKYAFNKLKGED